MKNLLILLFACLFSLLGGCIPYVEHVSTTRIASFSDYDLSDTYFNFRKLKMASPEAMAVVGQELRKRGCTERDIAAARQGQIFVGMNCLAVVAAIGHPIRANVTTTRWGISGQYIFGSHFEDQPYYYVYIDNGIVTAIQNREEL